MYAMCRIVYHVQDTLSCMPCAGYKMYNTLYAMFRIHYLAYIFFIITSVLRILHRIVNLCTLYAVFRIQYLVCYVWDTKYTLPCMPFPGYKMYITLYAISGIQNVHYLVCHVGDTFMEIMYRTFYIDPHSKFIVPTARLWHF